MLKVWENYAVEHNLEKRIKYPAPLQLNDKDLPWVETADHLGHTLHQLCKMDADSQKAKRKFVHSTMNIREQLSFAHPQQVLNAIQV